ncbi:DUF1583 domain-containing protein [Rhodopirellula sp. P2]|uniref:DUF1583 domain-containing protein n=1 Tax=Rhodopirellula sp. P2 TaxID=2127060 RepID=UPI0023689DD2|nr:DUF1583 domain-containing protein [Rhodopirellula sp. P2]WDQ16277.1 DUF1583 domain-containing protein [Rhodopirellula sp. P2]
MHSRRSKVPWQRIAVAFVGMVALFGVSQSAPNVAAQDGLARLADLIDTTSVAKAKPSYAALVLPALQDRDPKAAWKTLDEAANSLSISDMLYSDLPAAAAALNRSLVQLSSDQQYELLEKWTLPTEQRKRVRILSTPVPTDAPPKVFARSIGERPRDNTFAVASVGPVPGFFCSGWALLQAANELGRLPRLRIVLEELHEQNVSGAEEMLVLSQLLGSRGNLEMASEFFEAQANPQADATPLASRDMTVAAIAAAAMQHEATQAAGEACLASLVDRAVDERSIGMRPFLRIAHALAVQSHRGESPAESLFQNQMQHWVPVTVQTAKDIQRGQRNGMWLTHERHVLHVAGGAADVLFCRFPLVGSFDFVCETQSGGSIGTDGGLVYGGLHFQATGRNTTLSVWDADTQHRINQPSPFARTASHPVFNRVSIRSTEKTSQFESNLHPIWFDDEAARTSPWLGLRSSGTKRPVFRNLLLTGKPVIPRQVNLIAGEELRGWQSSFYDEAQLPFRKKAAAATVGSAPADLEPTAGELDWQVQSGVLLGDAKQDPAAAEHPGLLQYQRPLGDGESIAYQFFFDGDASIVHPAVGRMAFLLEPSGMRVRWLTTGSNDWTTLPMDNAALEPLSRRGPRSLPLKPNEDNDVRLELFGGKVLVHLNDELVYQRDLEPGAGTQFGLYRSSRGAPAKIQSVVMKGDWPETIPEEFLANPLATVDR